MKLLYNDVMIIHYRFSELNEKYLRNEISFKDIGYVANIDIFLTGCLSNLYNHLNLDNKNKVLVILSDNDQKRFKTLLDFVNNKIQCQGLYFSEIEGYLQHRIMNLSFVCNFILSPSENKQELVSYFNDNF